MVLVSIRPNLNRVGMVSVHKGRLGRVLFWGASVTIECQGVILWGAGHRRALEGDKTIHAALLGNLIGDRQLTEGAKLIRYNPHLGDIGFSVDGEPYSGGGVVVAVGWRFYLI